MQGKVTVDDLVARYSLRPSTGPDAGLDYYAGAAASARPDEGLSRLLASDASWRLASGSFSLAWSSAREAAFVVFVAGRLSIARARSRAALDAVNARLGDWSDCKLSNCRGVSFIKRRNALAPYGHWPGPKLVGPEHRRGDPAALYSEVHTGGTVRGKR